MEGNGAAAVAMGGAFACGSEGRERAFAAETEVGGRDIYDLRFTIYE